MIKGKDLDRYSLSLLSDPNNEPVCYQRYLVTGVCDSEECKPIAINLYWDLLGNYVYYELPPDAILTKVDHIPFEDDDYRQLHEILMNDRSILQDFDVDMLTRSKEDRSLTIDAMTGATPKTIKSDVIEGALYTSHTLWHMANGSVQEDIAGLTRGLVDSQLLHRFLESRNHDYRSWAIDWVLSREDLFDEFMPDILNVLKSTNVFAAQHIVNTMPMAMLAETHVQKELYATYRGGSYRLKTRLLQRLQHVSLDTDLLVGLSSELHSSNDELFSMIMELLSLADRIPDEAITHVTACLESRPNLYSDRVYTFLSNLPQESTGLKRALRQYKERRNK
jgi:hypothetical protein